MIFILSYSLIIVATSIGHLISLYCGIFIVQGLAGKLDVNVFVSAPQQVYAEETGF